MAKLGCVHHMTSGQVMSHTLGSSAGRAPVGRMVEKSPLKKPKIHFIHASTCTVIWYRYIIKTLRSLLAILHICMVWLTVMHVKEVFKLPRLQNENLLVYKVSKGYVNVAESRDMLSALAQSRPSEVCSVVCVRLYMRVHIWGPGNVCKCVGVSITYKWGYLLSVAVTSGSRPTAASLTPAENLLSVSAFSCATSEWSAVKTTSHFPIH